MTDNKVWFEQMFLDGDKIQQGQMLSSEAAYEATEEARADERKKVLAEVEGWLDEMPIWIDGVDMSPFRAELRAKLVEMKGEDAK